MATSPTDQILSKAQRNKIYRAIASTKLNPAECEYRPLLNGKVARIVHTPSRSEFVVEGSYTSESFLVGTRTVADVYLDRSNRYDDFDALISSVKEWAATVAGWTVTPDLWENHLAPGSIPGELTPDSANTPFTTQEQKAISGQLRSISEAVKKNYDLTAEQSAELDEKFEAAEKASRRMGRKDWGLLFGGAVFSLILSDATTPGIAGHILMLMEHGIGHLFMGTPPSVRGILSASE